MNKTILTTFLALSLVLATGTVKAQMGGGPGMMNGNQEQPDTSKGTPPNCPNMGYPGMMGGYGYGMGPGMMGGYGMGPGVMGGYGMGPGMMRGYGMGPRMMDDYGYGMGPGMMRGYGNWGRPGCNCYGHYGRGRHGFVSPEQYRKFMDETRDLRKKLHDLRFDYREMARDPKADQEKLAKMEKEMDDLQRQIWEKAEKK